MGGGLQTYFAIITTGVLVSSLQDPIGSSVWNQPHKKDQKTPIKQTAPTRKLYSDCSVVHSRPEMLKMAKISLFNRNLREEKLSFQPDQPGGKCFWVTTTFPKKIHSNETFLSFNLSLL